MFSPNTLSAKGVSDVLHIESTLAIKPIMIEALLPRLIFGKLCHNKT